MFKYTPHFIPSSIFLVGCGGTGSRLVPMMTQLVKTVIRQFNPLGWKDDLPVFLIDDDVVEEKNLKRQNFIQQDIGKNKAVVLAERYSRGMGLPLYPVVRRINFTDSVKRLHAPSFSGNMPEDNIILIMAVDSPQARRDILKCFLHTPNIFIIDAGNEDNFGQVKFFTNTYLTTGEGKTKTDNEVSKMIGSIPKMIPEPIPVNYIPYSYKYYENLGTTVAEKSCADLDQTLAINAMMATIMCGILQNFLYAKPFTYNQINYNLNGAVSTVFNTPKFWFSREMINDCTETYGLSSSRLKWVSYNTGKFSKKDINSDDNYLYFINFVRDSLSKMGLTLDVTTGECGVVSLPPVSSIQEEVKVPKKKSTKILEATPAVEIG